LSIHVEDRTMKRFALAAAGLVAGVIGAAPAAAQQPAAPAYDEALARSVGADEMGMRRYVFVLLKTGPNKMPAGAERDAMFKGHFANMKRLSDEGKLALAGPYDGVDGWRGMFVFAVPTIAEAKQLTETDPVLVHGEMVAEYHTYYGSAALMLVRELHEKVQKKSF
jgi:uncharacterized protein YciI